MLALLYLVAAWALGAAELSVTPRSTVLYSTISPKLRIQGEGFKGIALAGLHLEFVPPLKRAGKPTYTLNLTETALVIGLKKGESWPLFDADAGTTLFLSALRVGDPSFGNVLGGPVPVARVIAPPSVVKGEDKIVYATGTKKFLINGTGFREGMNLVFDPPLARDVDYAQNVRSSTAVQLLLKTGRKWRGEPGPLKLRRIDVGGGALRVDPKFGGVTVAEVQADLGGHGVSAEAEDQWIYQSAKVVTVTGTGFEHARSEAGFGPPKLRWGNGLRGRGVNYTTSKFDESGVTLARAPGTLWRRNGAALPAPLILLAADAGTGFVGVGATEAKKGVRVATVFEDPAVAAAAPAPTLFRTHSAQLWLRGRGFVRPGTRLPGGAVCPGTSFAFDPPLAIGRDVLVTVFNRTHALVRLREGKAWAATAGGPLRVASIATPPAGNAATFAPTVVAMIAPDAEAHASGVNVHRSNHQVLYQHVARLTISGSRLTADADLTFDPPLVKGADYDVARASASALTLALAPGRAWRATSGPLVLKALRTASDADPMELAHGAGLVVADVVADPAVAVAKTPITASTTRRVSIRGSGFDLDGVAVALEPTWASAYEVEAVHADEVVLRLVDGKAWTPSGAGVKYKIPPAGVPLVVTKITASAGEFVFRKAVQIATIVADDVATDASGAALICDDSCDWALDGVCDDGSRATDDDGRAYAGDDRGYYDDGAYDDGPRDSYDDDGAAPGGGQDGEPAYYYDYDYDYEYFYDGDYYGYYGDDFGAAACARGTDCTDCGGSPLGPGGVAPAASDFADDGGFGGGFDFDDDEWFDDDAENWWDDDYDFGEDWNGFDDDEYAAGIIQSVESTKAPHKRHSGDHADTHWFHKRKDRNGGGEPTYEDKFTYVFEAFLGALFIVVFGGLFFLSYADADNRAAHPCAKVCPSSAATDDIEKLLGAKAAQD